MTEHTRKSYIYVDPYTVTSSVVSGASALLQFLPAQELSNAPLQTASILELKGNWKTLLIKLENAIDKTNVEISNVLSAIKKGAQSADIEFYDAKFGLSTAMLRLEHSNHLKFSSDLNHLYAKVGQLTLWVNFVISSNTELTSALGELLAIECNHSPEKLTQLMRDGASNRQLLSEARFVYGSLRDCVKTYQSLQTELSA